MSNNTTPEGARHEPLLNYGSIPADGVHDGDDVTGGGTSMQPEFATMYSSSVCKKVYVDSVHDKTILYVLSNGLEHDNEPLFPLEQEPWSTLSKSTLCPPKNSHLVKEGLHRATSSNMRLAPRPRNWTRNQMMEWLEEHPVTDSIDDRFLTFEVLRIQQISSRMQQEQQQLLTMEGVSSEALRGGNWRDSVPYLRVIMTLTRDDQIVVSFSRKLPFASAIRCP